MSIIAFLFLLPMPLTCLVGVVVAITNWSTAPGAPLAMFGCLFILASVLAPHALDMTPMNLPYEAAAAVSFLYRIASAVGVAMILFSAFARTNLPRHAMGDSK